MADKNVSIRMPAEWTVELERRYKAAGFKSLQDAGKHAYEAVFWGEPEGIESEVPLRLRPYLRKLARLLISGDEGVTGAIQQNIDQFLRVLPKKRPAEAE